MSSAIIYKLLATADWAQAQRDGVYLGSAFDDASGFIHFSAADQVAETAALHFVGSGDLTVLAVDSAALGDALVWEPSRGGMLFPHLYGPLQLDAVLATADLPAASTIDPIAISAAVTAALPTLTL